MTAPAAPAAFEGKTVEYVNGTGSAIANGTIVSLNSTYAQVARLTKACAIGATESAWITGVWTVDKATASDAFSVGEPFKLDASGEIVKVGGTGSPDVTVSNACVHKASATTDTTVDIIITGLVPTI